MKGIEKEYICSDIEINCAGPKPVRGYFAKPENAAPKSLPAVHLSGKSFRIKNQKTIFNQNEQN